MGLPEPMVPAEVDLRDFAYMPIDIIRLFGSEFHANATDAEWRAGVTLWLKSYHQVPAASIPDDDVALARLAELGRDLKAWKKIKANALRGWNKCADGRLYHPVVAEKVIDGWNAKQLHVWKRECDRLRKENKVRMEKRMPALTMPAKPGDLVWNSERTRYEFPRKADGVPAEIIDFPSESSGSPMEGKQAPTETLLKSSGNLLENRLKGEIREKKENEEKKADLTVASDPEPAKSPAVAAQAHPPSTDAEIERLTYAKGKSVLGPKAGSQITQLVRAKNGSFAQALAAIDKAADKQNSREYIASIIHRGTGAGPPSGLPYDPSL